MIVIPFMKSVRTANLTVTVGTCLYDEATKVSSFIIVVCCYLIVEYVYSKQFPFTDVRMLYGLRSRLQLCMRMLTGFGFRLPSGR